MIKTSFFIEEDFYILNQESEKSKFYMFFYFLMNEFLTYKLYIYYITLFYSRGIPYSLT